MISLPQFNEAQKIVIGSAIAALIFSTTFVSIAYLSLGISLPEINTSEQRLIFALRYQIFPALTLFAGIVTIGNSRFLSPAINPLAHAESEKMQIHLRYLSNTLEQVVLFFISSLVLTTFLNSHTIYLIPILSILFVIGRLTFWLGYLKNPMYRAFGMAVTLYPNAIMMFCNFYYLSHTWF